ncbi:MAG TPA: recombinase family protein [Gammaproteobacteria bacterium]|nr:recombinase family protein [Gammaproteobacteria bacterium]
MSGKTVGYIRVSTLQQNANRQLEGIKLDKMFIDQASGKDLKRPQLSAMLDFIREGDTVVVHSMDRLARNLADLKRIVSQCTQSQITIRFLKEGLTFTGEDSPMANLLLSVMGGIAEFERALIHERQAEGIALAQKKGVYFGRKKALNAEQVDYMKESIAKHKKKKEIAKELGVSRETVYRYLKESALSC